MNEDNNTLNEYLIENTPRFGLLDKETQKHLMRDWPHGWQVWNRMDAPPKLDKEKIIMNEDINTLNEDLIQNTTPFGLLEHETRHRLMAWKHGWEVFDHRMTGGWGDIKQITLVLDDNTCEKVFRARPARGPEPEPVEVQCDDATTTNATDKELMKIIANSAQELRERGYVTTLIPVTAPMQGEEDTRCRVNLTRSFTIEHNRGKHD